MKERQVGVVIIGRNEGERLVRCLNSFNSYSNVVYVDSGSTDSSVYNAIEVGVDVLHLDMNTPFTAARARNEGWKFLANKYPDLLYVQFADGDCEYSSVWVEKAYFAMSKSVDWGVVFGKLKEKHPENSIYNQICDEEWSTAIGEVNSCGGNAFIRLSSLVDVDGYDDSFIAGEEPEMCYRLRKKNWKILSLDEGMAYHDANILSFTQYWARSKRCGFAYALAFSRYGFWADSFNIKGLLRAWFWVFLFLMITSSIFIFSKAFFWLILIFPLQVLKVLFKRPKCNMYNLKYSTLSLVTKLAEFQGSISYIKSMFKRTKPTIIEYK